MTEGFVLGVDLGTSHTVAMLRRPDGRTRPLLFDGRPLLPSAVYLDTTGRLHVGADALRLGHAEPTRLEPHPKRRVDDGSVLLGDGVSVPVADLLAAVLGAVAREAVATAGFLPPAVVTHPASWGAPRRAVLVEALGRAGWPDTTELLPEPVAAARYFAEVLRRPLPVGASLAVFDFGGGTLDVAVVRHDDTGPAYSVTASGGADDLGGLDLDAALVDHLGKSLAGGEPAAWQALAEPVTLAQWRARRQFWDDVRGAKEMLSRSSFAPVPVPGVEHAVHLTRDELEAAVDPLVRRGVAEAAEVVAAAGIAPADLAGLFLVGGSSRVPLVARLLHSELGIAPTVLEQPELPVAEGATLATASAAASSPASPPASPPASVPASPPAPTGFSPAPTGAPPITDTRVEPGAPVVHEQADDRHYAQPVDPWATGEAAAVAEGGHGLSSAPPAYADQPHTPGPHLVPAPPADGETWLASAPGGRRPRRRRLLVAGAAAAALVLAAGAALTWVLWPDDGSLDYHPLSTPRTLTPAIPVSGSSWSKATVRGDRAYFATADPDGAVAVTAAATDGGAAWTHTVTDVARRWKSLIPLPVGVALLSEVDYDSSTRQLVVLSAGKGDQLWQHTLNSRDEVYFAGDVAVIDDRESRRLLALSLTDGSEQWQREDPAEGESSVHLVTTPADLDRPAGAAGQPFAPDLGDDPRIVQIGGDRSARVIDADSGDILSSRPNVADYNDAVIAHNDRLVVRESDGADRIVAYSLDPIGKPVIVYTAPSPSAGLDHLAACGDDRVCAVEGTGTAARVVALDVSAGDRVWQADVPNAGELVGVGEAVLAGDYSATTLLDADGTKIWTRDAAAGRLDDDNLLEFNKGLVTSPDDPALAGRHLGDDPVQLGPLNDVITSTCAWNTSVLACVARDTFVLIDFAG